jgi:ribose transport system substrate-binding protein
MKRKITTAVLATGVAAAMALTGCTSSESFGAADKSSGPKKIEKIGLMVQDLSNPFFSVMQKGVEEAAKKLGAKVNTQDARQDLANQNEQIDAFIQQGIDLILINAVDEEGIGPAIDRAKKAGIIVIALDSPAAGMDALVMTDVEQAGFLSCDYLAKQIGGSGNMLIVDGTPIPAVQNRVKGCDKALKAYPDIKVVGKQAGKNDRATALTLTTDMLTANRDLKAIWGINDPSALGAVLAVEQANRTGIKITGVDAGPEGVEALKTPGSPFIGTATQSPRQMAIKGVEIGVGIAAGKKPAESTILIPSELITPENVSSYPGW